MSKALMFTISINGISKLNICADSACTVSHLMGFIRYWRSTLAKAVAKGKASLCEYHLEHMSKTVVFKALRWGGYEVHGLHEILEVNLVVQ